MDVQRPCVFIHGLESSSQGYKARFFRERFPTVQTPDFTGDLEQRMEQLAPILAQDTGWIIIGSSFGGLMGTLFTCQHPHQVHKLILCAPALTRPFFASDPPAPVSTPTVMYHGKHDTVVPMEPACKVARHIFHNLSLTIVDDDHTLHTTVQAIDWQHLLFH